MTLINPFEETVVFGKAVALPVPSSQKLRALIPTGKNVGHGQDATHVHNGAGGGGRATKLEHYSAKVKGQRPGPFGKADTDDRHRGRRAAVGAGIGVGAAQASHTAFAGEVSRSVLGSRRLGYVAANDPRTIASFARSNPRGAGKLWGVPAAAGAAIGVATARRKKQVAKGSVANGLKMIGDMKPGSLPTGRGAATVPSARIKPRPSVQNGVRMVRDMKFNSNVPDGARRGQRAS